MHDTPPPNAPRTHPTLVTVLGYAGLLPFAALALAVWWPGSAHRAPLAFALLAYGATIASFLGAIHWGLAMRDKVGAAPLYLWGVSPSLLAWLALLAPVAWGLLLLALLLLACYAVDRRVYPHHQLQGWLPMRLRLTGVASASCLTGALGLLQ